MKTTFIQAHAWHNIYKSYYYHGKLMQCKNPPDPLPFIGFTVNPPINPSNYTYPCDGLPATATPPMQPNISLHSKLTAAGGLLTFQSQYSVYGGASSASFKWIFTSPIKIEFEVSFPRFQYTANTQDTLQALIMLPSSSGLGFKAQQTIEWVSNHYEIINSFFKVYLSSAIYYSGSFLDHWRGKLVKTIGVNKWNIFLNDVLIKSDLTLSPNTLAFYFVAGNNNDSFMDMDYLNAWVNIDRVP